MPMLTLVHFARAENDGATIMGEARGDLKFQKVKSHIASAGCPSFFSRRIPDLVFASQAEQSRRTPPPLDIPGNIAEAQEAQVRARMTPAYVVSANRAIFDAVWAGGAIAPRCNSSFLLYMIADLYAKGESPHLANLGERERERGCGVSTHCAVACFSG